jgi:hypothetical protein
VLALASSAPQPPGAFSASVSLPRESLSSTGASEVVCLVVDSRLFAWFGRSVMAVLL